MCMCSVGFCQKDASGQLWPEVPELSEQPRVGKSGLCPVLSNLRHLPRDCSLQLGNLLAGRWPEACIPHRGPVTIMTIFSLAVKSNWIKLGSI